MYTEEFKMHPKVGEQQNHCGGRDFWRLFSPARLPKARAAKAGCPGPCPRFWLTAGVESGQPAAVGDHACTKKMACFFCLVWFWVFNV